MKFGICLPIRLSISAIDNVEIAETAENQGVDSIWVSDHVVMPEKHTGSFSEVFYDPFMLLSYIAAETSKITLGTSVIILPYRNPVVVAKMISTLDVLSEGRVIFGVGPGWMREEFAALSVPFDRRGARTNEYIATIKELWSSDDPSIDGEFCSFSDIKFYPKPQQKPHPPIFIAGSSDYAIKRAVDYGDGWQPTWVSPEDVSDGKSKLEQYAYDNGKDLTSFTYSVRNRLDIIDSKRVAEDLEGDDPPFLLRGSVDEIIDIIKLYDEIGVSHIVLDPAARDLDDFYYLMEIVLETIIPAING